METGLFDIQTSQLKKLSPRQPTGWRRHNAPTPLLIKNKVLFDATRAVILNDIDEIITRPDLAYQAIEVAIGVGIDIRHVVIVVMDEIKIVCLIQHDRCGYDTHANDRSGHAAYS